MVAGHLSLRSGNPVLKADIFTRDIDMAGDNVMTIGGTVNKTALALIILVAAGSWTWKQAVLLDWLKVQMHHSTVSAY